eukprot:CAMPEP_0119009208 /NCGR_PEP_ID=MMETSP1176-20130426/4212_1 /TAXON_ID=265551 /ORGANISM="Synedropsis recta cf, Strain CCMP1620" /LENGTH=271 /DNA_ID=CAMNT_0006961677 /DNA_START=96 /DNA_END=911 /DNA_ORIENTATION=+
MTDYTYGAIPAATNVVPPTPPTMKQVVIAEIFGTCILVQIGCGGLAVGLYMGALNGLWQMAVIWLLGATLAIYAVGNISGAHLNPAVTLAFAMVRPNDFPWKKLLPYWGAQLLGGMIAGTLNLAIFYTDIRDFETKQGLTRGDGDAIRSASTFGDYWSLSSGVAGPLHAVFIEAFGTAFLTFCIFAVTNPKNNVPASAVAPLVGTAIGMMVALLGSLTGAGINPARDFGPRLITAMAGWGTAAFTDCLAYLIGPLIGGPIGAYLADRVVYM